MTPPVLVMLVAHDQTPCTRFVHVSTVPATLLSAMPSNAATAAIQAA